MHIYVSNHTIHLQGAPHLKQALYELTHQNWHRRKSNLKPWKFKVSSQHR